MNLKKSAKRVLLPIKQHYESKLHELRYIFFELTHKCNLSCIHCGSDCQRNETIPDLPAEKVIEVLRDIKTKYDSHKVMVVLSGGEPTIYPNVFELGRKIYELEFPWGMVTNGLAWDKEMIADAKAAKMHSVTVSLDGLEAEHNWMRGEKNSFQRALNTITMLNKDRFWRAMDVITCVNSRNIHQLDDIYNLLKSAGVKRWRFFTISPIGRAVKTPELFLNPDQFQHLMNKIVEFKSRKELIVNYSESGYLGPKFERVVRGHDFFCRAGINVSGVMVNGDILACPNIDRRFSQGNVFKERFIDVWENKYQKFRDRSWMKKGDCSKCPEWRQCRGNGMHLWDLDKNEPKVCHCKKFDLI